MNTETNPNTRSVPPSINVTPLIDVLLVLLIIFMVISPRNEQKLPVKSPAIDRDGTSSSEVLMLTVGVDLMLELNSRPILADDLKGTLATLMEQRTADQRTLFIKAPKSIPYDPVVGMIDSARGAGVVTIGLIQN